jgi:hypothetical protein
VPGGKVEIVKGAQAQGGGPGRNGGGRRGGQKS